MGRLPALLANLGTKLKDAAKADFPINGCASEAYAVKHIGLIMYAK
jgi:hypothetical protein